MARIFARKLCAENMNKRSVAHLSRPPIDSL